MAPVIEGLSQHRVTKGEMDRIYVNGSGFTGATGVQIGDAWGGDHVVDGEQSACDGHVGATLTALVISNGQQSVSTEAAVTVLEAAG